MFETGEYILSKIDFTSKDWGVRTGEYMASILKIKHARWVAIHKSLKAAFKNIKKKVIIERGPPAATNSRELAMPDSDPVMPDLGSGSGY